MSKYNQYTAIYTDGSKEQGNTACAFVTIDQATTYRLPDESDIVEAELQAILMACQYITDHPEIKKAVLYTDSMTALDLLNTTHHHDYRAYTDLILQSNQGLRLNGTDVVLAWVPSHVGIPGNEAADHHAKLGRSLPVNNTRKKLHTVIHCKEKAHDWMLEAWQDHYDKQAKALHYKTIESRVTTDIKYTAKHRRTEVIITRLRLGHCLTNERLHDYNCSTSADCPNCGIKEDLTHLITCPHARYLQGCETSNLIELLKDAKQSSQLAKNIIASKRRI